MSAFETYFDVLIGRCEDSIPIPYRRVVFANGTEPQPNTCHGNIDRWVLENPATRCRRGWLVHGPNGGAAMFMAHSVVEDAAGLLLDITPMSDWRPPFLLHLGNDQEFDALVPAANHLIWPRVTDLPTGPFDEGADWSAASW